MINLKEIDNKLRILRWIRDSLKLENLLPQDQLSLANLMLTISDRYNKKEWDMYTHARHVLGYNSAFSDLT